MTTLAALFADTSALDRQPAHVRYAPHARARKVAVMDDSSTDDAQLMLDYASGNARAFELLYARHRSGLYRYLMRHARDPDLANDLFQDVWGRVIANRSRYEPRAKFQTFLFTLAHNCFIDHCRRTAARPRGESIDSTDTEDSLAAPDELRPDIELERADDTARYRAALASLPAEQRDVFLLHEESLLSVEEIAKVVGVGAETAKSRLRYAVNKLKRALTPVASELR